MAMLTSYSLLSWSPSVCLLLCIRIRSSHIFIHVGYLNISSSPFSWMAFSQFPRTRNISMSSAFMPTMGPPQVLTYCTWSSSSCAVSELAARELAVKNIPYPQIKKKKKKHLKIPPGSLEYVWMQSVFSKPSEDTPFLTRWDTERGQGQWQWAPGIPCHPQTPCSGAGPREPEDLSIKHWFVNMLQNREGISVAFQGRLPSTSGVVEYRATLRIFAACPSSLVTNSPGKKR